MSSLKRKNISEDEQKSKKRFDPNDSPKKSLLKTGLTQHDINKKNLENETYKRICENQDILNLINCAQKRIAFNKKWYMNIDSGHLGFIKLLIYNILTKMVEIQRPVSIVSKKQDYPDYSKFIEFLKKKQEKEIEIKEKLTEDDKTLLLFYRTKLEEEYKKIESELNTGKEFFSINILDVTDSLLDEIRFIYQFKRFRPRSPEEWEEQKWSLRSKKSLKFSKNNFNYFI